MEGRYYNAIPLLVSNDKLCSLLIAICLVMVMYKDSNNSCSLILVSVIRLRLRSKTFNGRRPNRRKNFVRKTVRVKQPGTFYILMPNVTHQRER